MLKICRNSKSFTRLDNPTLAAASILERSDLQEYIANSPEAFFAELGENLFVLGKEVQPSETVADRIDLLAIDADGGVVVVELKRGNDKFQLLQAIAYAGMVSKWSGENFLTLAGARADDLRDFADETTLNSSQRIILVAEAYDYEVLAAAEWLYEQYSVEIVCARVTLAVDSLTKAEYMSCMQVFPTRELAEQAISRTRRSTVLPSPWTTWDGALSDVSNLAVREYFRSCLQAGQEAYLPKKQLFFRQQGKRRWFLNARTKLAYTWQLGRFVGDTEFWRTQLSRPEEVKAVKDGQCLRMFLVTTEDFDAFHQAVNSNVSDAVWTSRDADEELAEAASV